LPSQEVDALLAADCETPIRTFAGQAVLRSREMGHQASSALLLKLLRGEALERGALPDVSPTRPRCADGI